MLKYGGYCGVDCDSCEARLATAENDLKKLEELAAKAAEQFGVEFTAEQAKCVGCYGEPPEPLCGYCFECKVRACARERGFKTCAECPDYACETLSKFLEMAPKAMENLATLRQR